jgi:hypothetical protein
MDKGSSRIQINKEWHDLTPSEFAMMSVLIKAGGEWMGGKEIGGRPDRLMKSMPRPVADLIETHKKAGYRIPGLLKK